MAEEPTPHRAAALKELLASSSHGFNHDIEADFYDAIPKILDSLSDRERAVIEHRYFVGNAEPGKPLTLEQVAQILGVSQRTVARVEHRAIKNISNHLGIWIKTRKNSISVAASMDCYFDKSEFSPKQMAEVLAGIAAMYTSLTGDELVIDDCGIADASEVLVLAGGDA